MGYWSTNNTQITNQLQPGASIIRLTTTPNPPIRSPYYPSQQPYQLSRPSSLIYPSRNPPTHFNSRFTEVYPISRTITTTTCNNDEYLNHHTTYPPPPQFCQPESQHQASGSSRYAGYYTNRDKTELVFPAQPQPQLRYHQQQQQQPQQQVYRICQEDDPEDEEEEERSDSPSLETEDTVVSNKQNVNQINLNLDLTGLTSSDLSTSEVDDDYHEDDVVSPPRLGCGRVAALAKHFSQLGHAGLIKLDDSRRFSSEPDIASPRPGAKSSSRNKSETELHKSKSNKRREWSMILLDIQTKGCMDYQDDGCLPSSSQQKLKKEDKDKLSRAEREQIIEQLKEFENLDNVDAPLFIPNTTTSSVGSLESLRCPRKSVKPFIAGSVRLEHFRNHSLPTILSTLNVFPPDDQDRMIQGKINSLSKYWSLKDLAGSGDDLDSSNDNLLKNRKLLPDMSEETMGHEFPATNITIESVISFGGKNNNNNNRRRSDESATSSSSIHSSVRLSKSTSDISKRKLILMDDDAEDYEDEDYEDDDESESDRLRSKSWEKLRPRSCSRNHGSSNIRCNGKFVVMRSKAKSELDLAERKPTPRFGRKWDHTGASSRKPERRARWNDYSS